MLTAHSAQPQTMDGPRDYDPKKTYGDGTNGGGRLVISYKNKAHPVQN